MDKAREEKDGSVNLYFRRFEFKYIVNDKQREAIRRALLEHYMEVDEFALGLPDNAYTVNSIYFESPNFKCYREKIDGIRDRFKLRLRFYGDRLKDGSNAFLEIKRKFDVVILKERALISPLYFKNLLEDGVYSAKEGIIVDEQKVFEKFFYLQRRFAMKPLVGVKYKREAFVGRFNKKLRVTFDYNLQAYWHDNPLSVNRLDNGIVMEIKYNGVLPDWLLRVIQDHNIQRRSFSKYTNCFDSVKFNFLN